MIAKAINLELEVHVNIDTLQPQMKVGLQISEGFEFLNSNRSIIAGWLRSVADDIEASRPETTVVEEEAP